MQHHHYQVISDIGKRNLLTMYTEEDRYSCECGRDNSLFSAICDELELVG